MCELLALVSNRPATVTYAQALLDEGRYADAHELLFDFLFNVPPSPPEIRMIAQAAGESGRVADAHGYMAEYYLLSGDPWLAIEQLQLALATPEIDNYRQARFEARMDEIQEVLPARRPRDNRERG